MAGNQQLQADSTGTTGNGKATSEPASGTKTGTVYPVLFAWRSWADFWSFVAAVIVAGSVLGTVVGLAVAAGIVRGLGL